MTLLLTLCAQK